MIDYLPRVKCLLVDDRPENLLALSTLLRRDDVEVLEARSGAEALDLLLSHSVALALVDVQMPDMDGFELAELMRGSERTRDVPIIFVTGHGDVPMAVSTMKKGAMDFIEKPFDEAELRKLVERMLDKARSESKSVQEQRAASERLSKLTAREQQVLERIIAGRLNKQIADDLGISIKTVEAHRANIMEKLNVNTVADLLRLALSKKQA